MLSSDSQRLFAIANALDSGYFADKIWSMTKIDKWFLNKLNSLVQFAKTLSKFTATSLPTTLIREAKQLGFEDRQIAKVCRL